MRFCPAAFVFVEITGNTFPNAKPDKFPRIKIPAGFQLNVLPFNMALVPICRRDEPGDRDCGQGNSGVSGRLARAKCSCGKINCIKMFPPQKMSTADVVPVSLVSIYRARRYINIWLYVQFLLPW